MTWYSSGDGLRDSLKARYDEKFTQLKEITSFHLTYILTRDIFQFYDHIGLKKESN